MKANGKPKMRLAPILFLLASVVSACHPPYPTGADDELKPSPGGRLTARFFGVSTILLDDGNTAIITDGFFSRPGIGRLLFGEIAPDPDRIGWALQRGDVTKLSAVLTVHSHYDHAMDAPDVAHRWQAVVIGSPSTANIALGEGFPASCIRLIEHDRQEFTIGSFGVTAFRSLHSTGVPGGAAAEGTIDAPLRPPAGRTDYKEGGTFSFLIDNRRFRIIVHASTNYIPGMYAGVEADVVFLGIATLGKKSEAFASAYWREVVQTTKARRSDPLGRLHHRPRRPAAAARTLSPRGLPAGHGHAACAGRQGRRPSLHAALCAGRYRGGGRPAAARSAQPSSGA